MLSVSETSPGRVDLYGVLSTTADCNRLYYVKKYAKRIIIISLRRKL